MKNKFFFYLTFVLFLSSQSHLASAAVVDEIPGNPQEELTQQQTQESQEETQQETEEVTTQSTQENTQEENETQEETQEVTTLPFKDMLPDHPNYQAILDLKKRGIISGYPDGTFKPDQAINRVEALQMILNASKVYTDANIPNAPFTDVGEKNWYTKALNQAYFLEIIRGYPDQTFKPTQTVNLIETLAMLLKAKKISLDLIVLEKTPFADVPRDLWFSKYIQYAKNNKLISGDDDNRVFPDQAMNRGKVAEIISRLLTVLENEEQESGNETPAPGDDENNTQEASYENFSVFVSESFKFSIEYPKKWFYAASETTPEGVLRHYDFSEKPLDEGGISAAALEVISGNLPEGESIGYNNKNFIKTENTEQIAIYIKGAGTRIYKLIGPPTIQETLLKMADSVKEI